VTVRNFISDAVPIDNMARLKALEFSTVTDGKRCFSRQEIIDNVGFPLDPVTLTNLTLAGNMAYKMLKTGNRGDFSDPKKIRTFLLSIKKGSKKVRAFFTTHRIGNKKLKSNIVKKFAVLVNLPVLERDYLQKNRYALGIVRLYK
jgi:hypothetical protein